VARAGIPNTDDTNPRNGLDPMLGNIKLLNGSLNRRQYSPCTRESTNTEQLLPTAACIE